jgi:cyclophilin family peptidyl-prolyl cis-trans isomerase/HEAT repeat protein
MRTFLPPSPRWRRGAGTAALLALLLTAACSPSANLASGDAASGDGDPASFASGAAAAAPAEALPPPPGDLRQREDLRRLVQRQAARDTLALVRALMDDDAVVRARAALALGSFAAAPAVPALIPLLADDDPSVRAFAAFALGQVGDANLTGPLIDALHRERDPLVRRQVVHAMGRAGDRSALAALAGASLSRDEARARAIAIARFGMRDVVDPQATALLAALLADDDPLLRRDAAYFFGRITDTTAWAQHAGAIRAAAAARPLDDPAQPHLALALGRLGNARDLPHLERLLSESPDWTARVNAARALGMVPEAASGALLAALDDEVYHVAVAAAQALASRVGAAGALTEWAEANPDEWHVWTAFLPAIVRAGRTGAVRAALARAHDHGPFARAAALRALADARHPALLAHLLDAAADADPRIAGAALDALAQRWARQRSASRAAALYPTFAEGVRRADAGTVQAAAPALADSLFFAMGGGAVMREAFAALEESRSVGAMTAIVRAHGVARDTAALNFLIDVALHGPHPVVRRAATDALDQRFGEGIDFEPTGLSAPPFPVLQVDRLARLGPRPHLRLETERGTIVLELASDWAPITVLSITRLAEEGYYDGVAFHRVLPNFVAQGGDFARGDGFGGPEYFLPSEFTPLAYEAGALGMASAGPDTEGSQFFITHSMQPHLEGGYTLFGRVVAGQDVVDALRVGDRVLRARVTPGP